MPPSLKNADDSIFRNFAGELLLCYGGTDRIKCTKIKGNTQIVFNLEFPGTNSKLNFFTDSVITRILFFIILIQAKIKCMNTLFIYLLAKI